ncbi:MAG: amino acid permease [Acidobacteriaceae bacterium]|nr:amino acid permease [Acidobacteriaceae bacterium]
MSSLERRLGPLDAAAIVVSNVIGGGIFFVPILVARTVPDERIILLVWLAGGVFALLGALAYAEIGALTPTSGGEYVYLREAYGPLAGFLTGWTSFVAGFSGAIAASALALAGYLGRFVPAAADATPILTIPLPWLSLIVSRQALVALTVIAALTWIHVRGLGPGRRVQNMLAGAKVTALVVFVILALTIGHSARPIVSVPPTAVTMSGLLAAFVPVLFTYSGWNAAAYIAEEIRTPRRNIPIALGLGTAIVIAVYLALNLVNARAMSVAELATAPGDRFLDGVAERLFAFDATHLVAAFAVVSIAASISAMILAGPRVYFAMGRDGVFPASAARIHPRFRTPSVAIVAQSVWSGVLVLCSTLGQLVNYTGFALVLFTAVAVSSVFILRRRAPLAVRPFSMWGYPWTTAIFVIGSAAILIAEFLRDAVTVLAGLAVIAAGIPVYWATTRHTVMTAHGEPLPQITTLRKEPSQDEAR